MTNLLSIFYNVGDVDYSSLQMNFTFNSSLADPTLCERIDFLPDEIVEDEESFAITASSADSSVNITGNVVQLVFIADDDGKACVKTLE